MYYVPKVGEFAYFWFRNCSPIIAKLKSYNYDECDSIQEYIVEIVSNGINNAKILQTDFYTKCEKLDNVPEFVKELYENVIYLSDED